MKKTCAVCDASYETEDTRDWKQHWHPEPQSGPMRAAWLASGLEWAEYVSRFLYQLAFCYKLGFSNCDDEDVEHERERPSTEER